jgi:feruloyl esterase
MQRGSEYTRVPMFPGEDGKSSGLLDTGEFTDQFLDYLGFHEDPGPSYSWHSFDWDRGEKILIYWGWDDPAVRAGQGVDYHQTMTALMGGAAQTRSFFRLFMVLGMAHCRRGPGEAAIDYLRPWISVSSASNSGLVKRAIRLSRPPATASEAYRPITTPIQRRWYPVPAASVAIFLTVPERMTCDPLL